MQWTNLMNFNFDLGELPAALRLASVPAIYLVGGKGDWKTVREWWKRLHRAMDRAGNRESRRPNAFWRRLLRTVARAP